MVFDMHVKHENEELLSLDYLKQVLDFDSDTGIFTWKINKAGIKKNKIAGHKNTNGYMRVTINNITYLQHRLAWFYFYGEWPKYLIDHIDNDTCNNSIINLREANCTQNNRNKPINITNTTGFKGVKFDGNRFIACIRNGGKSIHIGVFDTAELAHEAYKNMANKLHGEFANYG